MPFYLCKLNAAGGEDVFRTLHHEFPFRNVYRFGKRFYRFIDRAICGEPIANTDSGIPMAPTTRLFGNVQPGEETKAVLFAIL